MNPNVNMTSMNTNNSNLICTALDDYKILMNNLKLLDFPFSKYEKEKSYHFTPQSFQK